jgi:hypothetical protein
MKACQLAGVLRFELACSCPLRGAIFRGLQKMGLFVRKMFRFPGCERFLLDGDGDGHPENG